ncbi:MULTISPECIES: superoxide dismutase [Pandoraea]|uniref:superoxide dismutase n=1 Tax=Pandoraea sp. LA3 TaxID=2094120 RepID=UPI002414279C|nr:MULTISPECIES: superoxide dismutase [Pandoraea]MCI3204982.1 superoxide dismutase [Pandoraea sp. LA3]MDN4583010.1 superoxide dismutase [Pandoraea capi]
MSQTLLSRRRMLTSGSLGGAALVMSNLAFAQPPSYPPKKSVKKLDEAALLAYLGASPQSLPNLPYAQDALEPVISARTIGIHYGKHHQAYFTNLHKLLADSPLANATLEQLILKSHGREDMEDIFNNAAQAWNHNFYWKSLSPVQTQPDERLAKAIVAKFGSVEALSKQLMSVSASQFGSGWGWLVVDDKHELAVVKTGNAETPFTRSGQLPLLTVDVWEHAYYLDYQNRRPDYLAETIAKKLNWTFASQNYARI